MSQFHFDFNSAAKMDEPLTKGPVPRWQKKGLESSTSSINISLNNSTRSKSMSMTGNGLSKTPSKHSVKIGENAANLKKTPSKTPSKTPKKSPDIEKMKKTPLNKTENQFSSAQKQKFQCVPIDLTPTPAKGARTPGGGDRFIPDRSATNFDLSHFRMMDEPEDPQLSPSQKDMHRNMMENLCGQDIENARVLAFQKKAPAPPDGHTNAMKVVYSQSKATLSAKAASRYISQAPDRILDAPELVDDYYLNLVDWNASNVLAVALGVSVYLWNADSGTIDHLFDLEGSDYVCSLAWVQEGNVLAVGTSLGTVQLWDTENVKKLRSMEGHTARVGALSWNSYILSSGCRSGQIIHHDVRRPEHNVMTLSSHIQEVCGLKWSPDGRYLASGGNDNMLNIWSASSGQMLTQRQPVYSLSAHQAAVKALAWCPWHHSLLASGGGTADRNIRFWNCNTGACLNSVDTMSQVCSILWSTNYKELVSSHGFAKNQLIIWKYPSLTKVTELTGHTARVLHLAMSPDGSTVISAGADETLRLWKCFAPDPAKKEVKEMKSVTSIFKQGIR